MNLENQQPPVVNPDAQAQQRQQVVPNDSAYEANNFWRKPGLDPEEIGDLLNKID